MKKRYFAFVFVILLFSLDFSLATSQVKSNNSTLGLEVEPDKYIKTGIYVLNLGKFDVATGSFTADFYLSIQCEKLCPSLEFEFMNGRASSFEKIIDSPNEKFYRIQANLVSPIDLKKFPFDKQKMQIILEDKKKTIEELKFIPDIEKSGIDTSIGFVGWDIEPWNVSVKEHHYETYNETYSQYVFEIPISRIKINSLFKTFLPVIFIVLVMISSFVLDPDKITTRFSMVSSALIASVMFHISIANQLPPVGYLTFADKFMVLTYFIILLSFAFNVVLLELNERKNEILVKKLHRATEFTVFLIVPILYLLLFLLAF
uniref:Neurotransmitter-gated ion-channel ligand-binding domain-containing protein n=1 Tax=Thermodesulfobium narugense TaxID=184064 RepID=A0A7C5P8X9_9BACT